MSDRLEFLKNIPIFSFLTQAELVELNGLFVEASYNKGETICTVGDPGDTFYVVLSGELEVWGGSSGQLRTGTLGPADFFGEMAILQGGKRTATVKISIRARLLQLDKASFEHFFLQNPKALEYFARVLCKRLASVTRGERVERATTAITVASRPGLKGKTLVATLLAELLKDMTGAEVLLVKVKPGNQGPQANVAQLLSDDLGMASDKIVRELSGGSLGISVLQVEANPDKTREAYGESASNLISKLSHLYPYIIFDLSAEPRALFESASMFSDVLIHIVDAPDKVLDQRPDSAMKLYQVINLHNASSRQIPINHCEPFVIPNSSALNTGDVSVARFIRENRAAPAALPLHRLAHKLLGSTVGLALGGGAAFGIAHLGVLKVLEQNNIPIDLVVGCSQGSIIGIGYAAGIGTEEMIAIARRLGRKRNFFTAMDIAITKPGLIGGNRLIEIFSPLLKGKTTFEDLIMPCRTVATDIESGERVPIGTGRLDLAFRASASVPMVMSPLRWNNRALVDGGVSDPVPAEIARQMGADLVIATNVVPPLKRGVENVVSKAYRQINRLNPLSYIGDSRYLPNGFDIIMNSMQILQYELGNFKAISADVLINPDLSDFTWIEYYRSEELMQRGIDAAEKSLPAIRKAIDDKLAPARRFAQRQKEQPITLATGAAAEASGRFPA